MFKTEPEPKPENTEPKELTWREKRDLSDLEAKKLEPGVLLESDRLFQEFVQEYQDDIRDYRYRINRMANWLHVFVVRQNRTFSTAINLDRVSSITLVAGR